MHLKLFSGISKIVQFVKLHFFSSRNGFDETFLNEAAVKWSEDIQGLNSSREAIKIHFSEIEQDENIFPTTEFKKIVLRKLRRWPRIFCVREF